MGVEKVLWRASARPDRACSSAAPISRAACNAVASAANATAAARAHASGQSRLSEKGREFSIQPKGESQASHELVIRCRSPLGVPSALPIPARRKVTRSTHTAIAFAAREVCTSCAAARPTPRKHSPAAPEARPATRDPNGSYPAPANATNTSAASTRFASAPWIMVANSGVSRPAGVATISSARPCSSSVRVWRTASKLLMNAAIIARNGRIRNSVKASSWAPEGRPRKSMITGLAITAASTATRSLSPPYAEETPPTDAAASAAVPSSHSSSCTQSRRSRCARRARIMLARPPRARRPRSRRARGRHSAAGTAPRARAARSAAPAPGARRAAAARRVRRRCRP